MLEGEKNKGLPAEETGHLEVRGSEWVWRAWGVIGFPPDEGAGCRGVWWGGHGKEGSGQLRKALVVSLKGWILPCRCRVDLPVCQQGVKAQACFRKMTLVPT